MRHFFIACLGFVLCWNAPLLADDNDKGVEFMYPLTLRRPVLETLVDLTAAHVRGREERETEVAAEMEWHILPPWLMSFEVPAVIVHDDARNTRGGLGDIAIENRFLLFKSLARQIQVTGGFEVALPTGSKRRGLGGETALEPFLAAGTKFGGLQLLADASYEAVLNSPERGERRQTFGAGLALGYELTERFLPLIELKTVEMVRGENDRDEPKLRHRAQLYVTPGFNVEASKETTLRFGVEIPATKAKQFDYAIRLGISIEF